MKAWTWKKTLLLLVLTKVLTLSLFAGMFPVMALDNDFNRSGVIFLALFGTPVICAAAGAGAGFIFSKSAEIGTPKKLAIGCGAAAFLLTLVIPISHFFR